MSSNASDSVSVSPLGRLGLAQLVWALCALLLLGVAVDQIVREGAFRVDDAYITFSFSKNLAAGHGPVFSHGLRVEGYSNFLWMVVVAVRFLFSQHGDPHDFAAGAALLFLAGGMFSVYRITRSSGSAGTALLSVGLLVFCSDLFRAAGSGLETAAYAAAIAFGWLVFTTEAPDHRRWSLVAFLPAALMRIDGFVPLLIVFGYEVLTQLMQARLRLLALLRWAAPAFAVWAAYFAWRYSYYGLLLPTTYYAKTVVATSDPDRGIRQAWEFLRDFGALPLLPLLLLPVIRGPRRKAAGLALAVLMQVGYVTRVGGDWMPFNRFFLPVVPLAAVLVAWGSEQVWRSVSAYGFSLRWGSRFGLGLALGFAALHMHAASTDTPQEADKLANAKHVASHTKDNLLAVKDLMAYVVRTPGDRLVTDYAGVFSVFTEAEIIDQWGLCNADIALNGGTNGINPIYGKECSQCYARLKPDYFHVTVPIVRGEGAFHGVPQIINNVFQGGAIDQVIDIRANFGAGRVVEESTGRALWFLERRVASRRLQTRRPAPGIRVDYPLEQGDTAE